ncbi:unnamed protein product [Lampetra fluviatilis]
MEPSKARRNPKTRAGDLQRRIHGEPKRWNQPLSTWRLRCWHARGGREVPRLWADYGGWGGTKFFIQQWIDHF